MHQGKGGDLVFRDLEMEKGVTMEDVVESAYYISTMELRHRQTWKQKKLTSCLFQCN